MVRADEALRKANASGYNDQISPPKLLKSNDTSVKSSQEVILLFEVLHILTLCKQEPVFTLAGLKSPSSPMATAVTEDHRECLRKYLLFLGSNAMLPLVMTTKHSFHLWLFHTETGSGTFNGWLYRIFLHNTSFNLFLMYRVQSK